MMLWSVILIPAVAGCVAMVPPLRAIRRMLLLLGAVWHSVAVVWLCLSPAMTAGDSWIALDAPGKLFLVIASALFLAAAVYGLGYLRKEEGTATRGAEEGFLFRNEPEGIFIGCLLLFLASMSLVCICQHLGLLWVAVEATTLASASLIGFHRNHRSLEATWKYLLICSVGIAMALLGIFFLATAGRGHVHGLTLTRLISSATAMDPVWLKAAFILLLVGFGTKMGLAPMHTWLPDAHSEAPSMVSALLSGALLNCAFLGILRGHAVLVAADLGVFSGQLLLLLGLLSMAVAAVFMIRQTAYKRMLAYSSIEHMGIMAIGVGLGGLAATGAMLHAVNHSFAKGLLFLAAGNLLAAYSTKEIQDVRGVLGRLPITGCLWLVGFLAITGSPPFGLFVSELTILKGAIDSGHWITAVLYLAALGAVFIPMARHFLPMAFGSSGESSQNKSCPLEAREPAWSVVPPLALGLAVLAMGLYVPQPLWGAMREAAAAFGGH